MTRNELILATLAAAERDFSPVQIQKALFLIDRKAPSWTGGPHFDFRAYDYGPFDASIYSDLATLKELGLVQINGEATSRQRRYGLTQSGRERGQNILSSYPVPFSNYVRQLVSFVQKLGFAQLVSSIYREYPEMKANSVFKE